MEQTDDGRYAVRARGSRRVSGLRDTQNEVRALAKKLNPDDHADYNTSEIPKVEFVTSGGPLNRTVI